MGLTANRDTPRLGDEALNDLLEIPIDASVHAYQGGMASVAAGYARPARATSTDVVAGVFTSELDNSAGAQAAATARIRRGTFRFANSASADLIAQADVKNVCYVVDDQTVAKTSGSGARPVAGIIEMVDASGVWVLIGGRDGTPSAAAGDGTGTPGNVTLNTRKGRAAVAIAATACVVTNSFIPAGAVVMITPESIDANALTKYKVDTSVAGQFTVTVNVAPAAAWNFAFAVQ